MSINRLYRKSHKERRASCYNQLEEEKTHRMKFSASIIMWISCIVILGPKYDFNFYQCISFIMLVLAVHFWMSFLIIILGFNELHHMRVRRRRSSRSRSLFVPYGIDNDVTKPMDSISAVIGLRGSNSEELAKNIFYCYASIAFITLFNHQMSVSSAQNDYCIIAMFACLGGWLLNTFSLEHKSFIHDGAHFVGAGLFMIGSVVSYGLQQNFSFDSQILIFAAIINIILYGITKLIKCDDRRNIHYQSVLMISFETIVVLCAMTANVMCVYHLPAPLTSDNMQCVV